MFSPFLMRQPSIEMTNYPKIHQIPHQQRERERERERATHLQLKVFVSPSLGLDGQNVEQCLVVLVDTHQATAVSHTLQQSQHHIELVHIQSCL